METPEQVWHAWWFQDLWRLHDRFVPQSCRHFGPCPAVAWAAFFSGCLVYDPPRASLLDFARGFGTMLDPSDSWLHPSDTGDADSDVDAMMVHAPLVKVRPERAVTDVLVSCNEEVFALLCAEVARVGIDLRTLRSQLVANHPEVTRRFHDRLKAIPVQRYIDAARGHDAR